VSTFSIGFPEEDYNELRFARLMANRLGTEHHELVIEPDAVDILEDLAWHLDEPFGDPSAIPTYFVSRLAAQHGKVVLSGDGGDELFAGYDKYAVEQRERRRERIPAPIRRLLGDIGTMLPDGFKGRNFLRHIALTGAARCVDGSSLFRADMKRSLFQAEPFRLLSAYGSSGPDPKLLARLDSADGDWLSVMQYIDLQRYLPLDILVKVDRMSMAHSLEVRPPLLDHKLVEFAATIPPELQLRGSTTKYIFKRALRGLLPDEIIDRPKRGFAMPLEHWFRGKLEGFVHDLLLSPTALQRGIFRPEYIQHLLTLQKKGKELDRQLWILISFEMWARTYLDKKPSRVAATVQ
jgi:asparagine synthase (glutamine-hydrolysing)